MFSKALFKNSKYFPSINNILRHYSDGKTVKIDDKCYVPVLCPQNTNFEDTSNKYIRITRQEPGKVRLGFVPDEWFLFFQEKTGVTGPYVFLVSISSFLISKEYYVMEHEYYSGLSIIIVLYYVATRLGSQIGNMIDKEVDKYELVVNSNREGQKKVLEDTIALENKLQESMAGQLMLQDAKKENVHLQLEAVFRERLLAVYKDVKRRLDFQISKVLIEKKFYHRNLIQWVVTQVIASYTAEQEIKTIDNCLDHLANLSANLKT
ncbi:mitochondrial atp synthase b chain [Holotrichia oblita]|uniref:Mitochondrial atp synthase b chain n=1 Tax=Holotrichia oblita TaxID=644536 RepID=A0ACB9TNE4_HOLOL|nr:mitochondrial atp synthase b chain [Holotrichia oblita]